MQLFSHAMLAILGKIMYMYKSGHTNFRIWTHKLSY